MSESSSRLVAEPLAQSYKRFVPEQFLGLVGRDSIEDVKLGDHSERTLTVMFADIRGFTQLSESMSPQENFEFVNAYLSRMEPVIYHHGGVIDKYIGDSIMAIFPGDPATAVCAAIDMLRELDGLQEIVAKGGCFQPFSIGIGVNTGVMMVGAIGGSQRMEWTVISDAVNLASRVETLTKDYGVPLLISEHTYFALQGRGRFDIRFLDRVVVKGKSQPQSVYEVYSADASDLRIRKRKNQSLFEESLALYHFKKIADSRRLLSEYICQCPDDPAAMIYLDRCRSWENGDMYRSAVGVDLKVEWKPSICIGQPEIDNQHRKLFSYTHAFIESVRSADSSDKVAPALDKLGHAVEEHFRDEEIHMQKSGYPFLESHRQLHERFLECFVDLKAGMDRDLANKKFYLLFRMQTLLIDWLITHTSGVDKHFGKYLAGVDSSGG